MPKHRKVKVTLELTVRDMTEREWAEANEGAELDEGEGPDGWVAELEGSELNEAIEGALGSSDNPDMFAGSGQFIVTENAHVLSVEWLPDA